MRLRLIRSDGALNFDACLLTRQLPQPGLTRRAPLDRRRSPVAAVFVYLGMAMSALVPLNIEHRLGLRRRRRRGSVFRPASFLLDMAALTVVKFARYIRQKTGIT